MKTQATKQRRVSARSASPRRGASRRKEVNRIDLLRARLAAAVTTWKQAKEHALQAKRRRKLAKLLARRAKKEARAAKENFEQLRAELARAEALEIRPRRAPSRRINLKKTSVSARRRVTPRAAKRKRITGELASTSQPPVTLPEDLASALSTAITTPATSKDSQISPDPQPSNS